MKYVIWEVYEGELAKRFYIVNTQTKQVQSVWKDAKIAKETCRELNRKVA